MRHNSPFSQIILMVLFLYAATVSAAGPSTTLNNQLSLYHLLQQRLDHSASLVRAERVGLQLLLTQLYTQMGLLQAANDTLGGVAGEATSSRMRDMVRVLLARQYQQRGEWERASRQLAAIDGELEELLKSERHQLLAAAALERNALAEALNHYSKGQGETVSGQLLRLNYASLLLHRGREEHGRALLQGMADGEAQRSVMVALRDRANLLLGYHFLQRQEYRAARQFLQRVHLGGPYSRAALLALGWAELELHGAEYAIAPWMELLADARDDSLEDEARLAVATAVASKGPSPRVIQHFEQLLVRFEQKRQMGQQQLQYHISPYTSQQLASLFAQEPGRARESTAGRALAQLLELQQRLGRRDEAVTGENGFLKQLQQLMQELYGRQDTAEALGADAHVAWQLVSYIRLNSSVRAAAMDPGTASAQAPRLSAVMVEREVAEVAEWYRHSRLSALKQQDDRLDAYMERARLAIARTHDQALSIQVSE